MKKPSDKQIKFATLISTTLNRPLPKEETAQAYFIFIRDNIIDYKNSSEYQDYLYCIAEINCSWKYLDQLW